MYQSIIWGSESGTTLKASIVHSTWNVFVLRAQFTWLNTVKAHIKSKW